MTYMVRVHALWQSGGFRDCRPSSARSSFPAFKCNDATLSSAAYGPQRCTPPGVEDNCTVSIKLPVLLFTTYILYATRGLHQPRPTAWIRSGVESGCVFVNSYIFLLPWSVYIVNDRPDYPRVKEVTTTTSERVR